MFVGQKLMKKVDMKKLAVFSTGMYPRGWLIRVDWGHKIHQDPIIPSKVIQLFSSGQTDRHTETCSFIHKHTDKNFNAYYIPFTSLYLLC
jgi:hypothetical protein